MGDRPPHENTLDKVHAFICPNIQHCQDMARVVTKLNWTVAAIRELQCDRRFGRPSSEDVMEHQRPVGEVFLFRFFLLFCVSRRAGAPLRAQAAERNYE